MVNETVVYDKLCRGVRRQGDVVVSGVVQRVEEILHRLVAGSEAGEVAARGEQVIDGGLRDIAELDSLDKIEEVGETLVLLHVPRH